MNHPQQPQQPAWGPPSQQPPWDAPPPQPPKKKTHPAVIAIAAVGIIGFWVVFGVATNSPDDSSSGNASASSSPAKGGPADTADKPPATDKTPGISKRELTELSVNVVWDGYDTAQRDALCFGVEAYGEDWLADQMQSDDLDPDYAAELVSDKCESR